MIGWFDGGAGASGDMLLGAFVGAGVPLEVPSASIRALDLGVTLRSEQVQRAGLDATRIHVEVPDSTLVRHLPDILALFGQLNAGVRTVATAVFERLAEAEQHRERELHRARAEGGPRGAAGGRGGAR